MGQMGDVDVPRNQALIIFANRFQVKSSQVISCRDGFPRDYSDDAVLILANN